MEILRRICQNIGMKSIDVAVLGANRGFIGQEAAEALRGHPFVDSVITPPSEELEGFEGAEVVFCALPHGVSGKYAAKFAKMGSTVIDYSGDLRFPTAEQYERWYGRSHPAPELLPVAYGLPEHSREELKGKKIAAMPGCYPTGAGLGLRPLVDRDLLAPDQMIPVNALSGMSGAGNKPSEATNFMTVAENAVPYDTGDIHRHVGEIEQFLEGRSIFFSPVKIPIRNGMLVNSNAVLAEGVDPDEVREALHTTYDDEPFVHILEEEKIPEIRDTLDTDECHIGVVAVGDSYIQIGSSLNNVRKGGATQGVHVWNIMEGFEETAGLTPKASMRG